MSFWERIKRDTSSTDWLIVLLTAVIAGTSYLQWQEIKSGGQDTHDLAVAAGKQADAAGKQADFAKLQLEEMKEQVTATHELAVAAQHQADAAKRAAGAARRSADTASRQLEMTDRPWIRDTVTSAFEIGWQHGSYLGWAVGIRIENVGHAVATGIFPEVKLIAIEGADFIDYPRREAKKICDDVDARFEKIKGDPPAWAASVYPGAAVDSQGHDVYLLPSEVEKKTFDGGAILGKSINPMLVGCIGYHFPSSEHAHHTGFIYVLSHSDDATLPQPTTVFFGIGKNIPKDKVTLTKVGQIVD
jgi:hypothetical protein